MHLSFFANTLLSGLAVFTISGIGLGFNAALSQALQERWDLMVNPRIFLAAHCNGSADPFAPVLVCQTQVLIKSDGRWVDACEKGLPSLNPTRFYRMDWGCTLNLSGRLLKLRQTQWLMKL